MMTNNSKGEYRDFLCQCPVPGCNDKEVTKLIHPLCGTTLQINQQGDICCKRCRWEVFILDAKDECYCRNNKLFSGMSDHNWWLSMFYNLNLMMNLASDEDRQWYKLLVENFQRRCDERYD